MINVVSPDYILAEYNESSIQTVYNKGPPQTKNKMRNKFKRMSQIFHHHNFTVNSENQSVQKISCLINIGGLVVVDLKLTFSPLFQGERSSCLYFNGCYQFGLCLSSWPLGLSSYPSAPHFWMTCLCEHVSSSSDSIFIAPHRFTGQGNPLCNVILTWNSSTARSLILNGFSSKWKLPPSIAYTSCFTTSKFPSYDIQYKSCISMYILGLC